jgi:hypothetical protein
VVDRMLTCPEDLNNAKAGGIGKNLERSMHFNAYVSLCIYIVKWKCSQQRKLPDRISPSGGPGSA